MSETLKNIKKQFQAARVARDSITIGLLSTIIGDIESKAVVVDGVKTVTEDQVVAVLKSFQKKNAEFMATLKPGDLIFVKINQEKGIIDSFLPQQLTEKEIKVILGESGLEDMGQMMKFLKENYSGQYDGKIASKVVKELLA